MENISRRKLMYKRPTTIGKSPYWKDAYRKKCLDRIRANRSKLVDQFRNCDEKTKPHGQIVQDIMATEWREMQGNNNYLDQSLGQWSPFKEIAGVEMRETFAEIETELADEEQRLINETIQHEKNSLNCRVAQLENEEVICPLCKVGSLQEVQDTFSMSIHNNSNTFRSPPRGGGFHNSTEYIRLQCACGLILRGSGLTLTMVRSSLQHTMEHHGSSCSMPLSFSSVIDSNGTNVFISCETCDWMSFLL